MNLRRSNSAKPSTAYDLLHPEIQRWIWQQNWRTLHDIQEAAIPAILEKNDVIIAAATASGKTEAAFFPILTDLLNKADENPTAIYISPLKALINDQWSRLELLCEKLNIDVTPWHGDIAANKKRKFIKSPSGCVLITPESLEALFMNHGYQIGTIFSHLEYCVIDELHAFIGNERGKQLQCLLHRLDLATGRNIPRIGLSATLGDMRLAANYLRFNTPEAVKIISSPNSHSDLKIALYGYKLCMTDDDYDALPFDDFVAEKLFKALRGSNNLIFPNTRRNVEVFSDKLRRLCENCNLPNEFWPHHGNLAKHIREETEQALKKKDRPASAVCTNTLELGIDIGAVKSVAQIGSPPSVSSLRQRIGRSGREAGEPSILRAFNLESELNADPTASDRLREQLTQSIAIIALLLEQWCESSKQRGLHLSTFIQQFLSGIVQYGGLTVSNAWKLLCESGLFSELSKKDFLALLTTLGEKEIIMQDHTGLLLLDVVGEKLVNHYSFYASFTTDEEFKLIHEGKVLGTLPIKRSIAIDSYLIFAGKRWKVREVNEQQKAIIVVPNKGGTPPLFSGDDMRIHEEIRQKMREILQSNEPMPFLDKNAAELLNEARFHYAQYNLARNFMIKEGKNILLFLWSSDIVHDTLSLYFQMNRYTASNYGLYLLIEAESETCVLDLLNKFIEMDSISELDLAKCVKTKRQEKWDYLLSEELLCKNYASQYLDIAATKAAISRAISTGLSSPF